MNMEVKPDIAGSGAKSKSEGERKSKKRRLGDRSQRLESGQDDCYVDSKPKKQRKSAASNRICEACATTTTPMWRRGPR